MVRSSEGSSCPSFLNAAPLMYTMSRPHLTRHLQHVLLPLPAQLKTHHVHRTISRIIHKVDFIISDLEVEWVMLCGEETEFSNLSFAKQQGSHLDVGRLHPSLQIMEYATFALIM